MIASFLAGLVYRKHGIWIILCLIIAYSALGQEFHLGSHRYIDVFSKYVLAIEYRGFYWYEYNIVTLFLWVFVGAKTFSAARNGQGYDDDNAVQ